ncbi:unnamed protein product [Lathyrus oleraceus]
MAFGEHANSFRGYVSLQVRSKLNILIDNWHGVHDELKDHLWTDITEFFIIPEDDMMKKKWIGYAGERWMGFRTELTSDYITKTKHNLEPSYIMYSYIDKKVYEEFSKSRRSLELLAKIQKGK